jgi:membrane protease YdiL (CAAX protease family)
LAGVILGTVRERSGSTAASALVHVVYNSTLFAGYLALQSIQR